MNAWVLFLVFVVPVFVGGFWLDKVLPKSLTGLLQAVVTLGWISYVIVTKVAEMHSSERSTL